MGIKGKPFRVTLDIRAEGGKAEGADIMTTLIRALEGEAIINSEALITVDDIKVKELRD